MTLRRALPTQSKGIKVMRDDETSWWLVTGLVLMFYTIRMYPHNSVIKPELSHKALDTESSI